MFSESPIWRPCIAKTSSQMFFSGSDSPVLRVVPRPTSPPTQSAALILFCLQSFLPLCLFCDISCLLRFSSWCNKDNIIVCHAEITDRCQQENIFLSECQQWPRHAGLGCRPVFQFWVHTFSAKKKDFSSIHKGTCTQGFEYLIAKRHFLECHLNYKTPT